MRADCAVTIRWQGDFYDHVLRESERSTDEFDAILAYIRGNPERAGLVRHWSEYPYISHGPDADG